MKLTVLRREFIFEPGQPGCNSVHASTIAPFGGGFAAAWFGGTRESAPDVRIWFSLRTERGWSRPVAVTPDNGVAHWNPVLFYDGVMLTLYYKEGLTPRDWRTMVTDTRDGVTFTEPRELVPGDSFPRGPVKNKPIRLSNGDLLAPDSVEDSLRRWQLYADISHGGGGSWTLSDPIAFIVGDRLYKSKEELPPDADGLIQPSAWEERGRPGRVHMLARSAFGKVYHTVSDDFGRSFSPAKPTVIPNNNSGLDCAVTESGAVVLCCNPVGDNWGRRWPVSLLYSEDNGESWSQPLDLESAEGEYSYPAIIADGGRLHITYTYNRRTIAYVEAEINN